MRSRVRLTDPLKPGAGLFAGSVAVVIDDRGGVIRRR